MHTGIAIAAVIPSAERRAHEYETLPHRDDEPQSLIRRSLYRLLL
jgi:hypothetical protein